MFKEGSSWEKIIDSDSSLKRGIYGTKFDIIFSWFSIWLISLSNFEILNFMWWLYNDADDDAANDAGDDAVKLIILYEDLSKLYAELFNADAWTVRQN